MNLIDTVYTCGRIIKKRREEMQAEYLIGGEKDFVVSFLKNQNKTLVDVTQQLEDGAGFDESIPHTLKRVEKDIRWLRKVYLNKNS